MPNERQSSFFVYPADGRTRVSNIHLLADRDPDDIYCGRPGHGERGPWGNPYSREKHPERALRLYIDHLLSQWARRDGVFRFEATRDLAGKRLLCFCVRSEWHTGMSGPLVCHCQPLSVAIDLARGLPCPAMTETIRRFRDSTPRVSH